MNNNKLVIAAAGSGKTTYLIDKALEVNTSEKVLITTYTEVNEAEIRKKILKKKKYIPSNITIQTWFSFLLQHGVRPYQGAMNEVLYKQDVKGMLLVNKKSGFRFLNKYNKPVYWGKENFKEHYFTTDWKIYSDKLSKFVVEANETTKGKVIKRISEIFQHIYIDEVQDLAGYDLEITKLLFKTNSSIILVGDPRQVTYLTHHESKYKKYKNGKIQEFINNELEKKIECGIDETTLNVSHRNNKDICEYSSKLYPSLPSINPCSCEVCRKYSIEHEGVFLIKKKDIKEYIKKYNPIILRWNKKVIVEDGITYNMGEAKGKTFERVLIYPTKDMQEWIKDNTTNLKNETKAKFYVAITRAKYSVGIVYDYDDKTEYEGLIKYQQ
ncbi:UvrD-helicase domain-containing protein [Lutibacter sp.]